jgi:UDP-glucose 4-epimerase
MRVLCTGAAGFLGRQVVARLRANPKVELVVSFDNLDEKCGGDTQYAGEFIGDVRAHKDLLWAIQEKKITHIVHLAAYGRNLICRDFPRTAWDVNVTGTVNILEIARSYSLKRVIVCSSNITLSDCLTVYRTTKQTCEELVRLYASMGVSCMGLRPSNIGGPGQSITEYQLCAFAALDQTYAKLGKVQITGDGTQSRDWVHVKDVARAFELALFSDIRSETINVSTGHEYSMNDIAEKLGVPVEYVAKRPGDAMHLHSNPARAKQALGFVAEYDLDKMIEDSFPCVTSAKRSQSLAG